MSKNSLNVPADAVELSMNDLEGVTGAFADGGSCSCGCFFAFEHNFKARVDNCVKFVSFGSCGSCWGGSCGSCWGGSCGSCWGGSCGSCWGGSCGGFGWSGGW